MLTQFRFTATQRLYGVAALARAGTRDRIHGSVILLGPFYVSNKTDKKTTIRMLLELGSLKETIRVDANGFDQRTRNKLVGKDMGYTTEEDIKNAPEDWRESISKKHSP